MKDTTQHCIILDKYPDIGGRTVTFSANGQLLYADIPFGLVLPESFEISLDGEEFLVRANGSEHFICPDDRDAFIAQVFG